MIDKKRDTDFVAYIMSIETFLFGLYLIYSNNYLIERFSLWVLSPSLENLIGSAFILISLVKVSGLVTGNKHLKRIGIISMLIVWALVVGLYIFEAFKLQFLGLIFTLPILVLCLRIARRGDFVE